MADKPAKQKATAVQAKAEAKPVEETKETSEEKRKNRKIWPVFAIIAAILIFVALVVGVAIYRLNSTAATQTASVTVDETDSSTETKDTNISQKGKPPKTKQSADDEIIYKGWKAYDSAIRKVYARYPAGWTMTETAGSPHVTFLGPPLAAGGVVSNECVFSIYIENVPADTTLEEYIVDARAAPQGGGAVVSETDTSISESTAFKVIDTYADVGLPWRRLRVWTIKNSRAYTFTFVASINYGSIDYYSDHASEADMILASVFID